MTDDLADALAAPPLSIPAPPPIGRLYRKPGSESLPTGPNGGIIVPGEYEIKQAVQRGEWVPSITNVLNVRNAEHLVGWAARKAANLAIEMEQKYPGAMLSRPESAARYLSTEHDRLRETAADLGTRVHYACELLANGAEDIPSGLLSEEELPYLDAWKQWRADFSPKFLRTEMTVFGTTRDNLGYAGTTDFLCEINGINVIGDIKTTRSGLHDDVAYQLSAVAHAEASTSDGMSLDPLPQIDAAYALHLSPKGYKFAPVVIDGEPWDMFQAQRVVWDLHAFEGHLTSGQHVVGSPVSGPEQVVRNRISSDSTR